MLNFKFIKEPRTGEEILETSLAGKPLLTTPQLNKGTAFTHEERDAFNLIGKLPTQVEPLEEQTKRTYQQYKQFANQLNKNIYLNNLHDTNEVLFYKLVSEHLGEMIPTIYTPIVGTAVKQFSQEFRQTRGLFISYLDKDIEKILENRSNPEIDLIVVTDGEGVLGIGDQGVGGMDIPIAKLMVYTLCGGISPYRALPIHLDVGTNNEALLKDPMYLGLRQRRVTGQAYDDFVGKFIAAVKKKLPNAFLHWEDLGRGNALRILDQYQHKFCTFNDDIQGTGAVTLSALLAAVHISKTPLAQQKIVIFGAGSAGTGIAGQICNALMKAGLTKDEACKRFWLIDRQGLLLDGDTALTHPQRQYARSRAEVSDWKLKDAGSITLEETIRHMMPTILIGCSAVHDAFSQAIISEMAKHVERPIIFPLSNPTEKCEAHPQDVLNWTQGRALIATGTQFENVSYENRAVEIAQCNNALVFPGIGLGVLAIGANRLSEHMLWRASQALTDFTARQTDLSSTLLPPFDDAQQVAKDIAHAVAEQAISEGLATKNVNADLNKVIDELFWHPQYLRYRRI